MKGSLRLKCAKVTQTLILLLRVLRALWQAVICPSLFSKIESLFSKEEVDRSACRLQQTEDGSYIIAVTSSSGNECWYILNHHQHVKGVPSKISYSTGDTCWFNPDVVYGL
jgi:hypothetical protein